MKHFTNQQVDFVLQLGDLVDGHCRSNSPHTILTDLLNEMSTLTPTPFVHCLGNHELYCLPRNHLASLFSVCPEWYYTYSPHPKWKVIVIDPFEICCMDPKTTDEAHQYLSSRNPNDVTNSVNDWFTGLIDTQKRFVPYNGLVSKTQLEWLKNELQCDLNVIVATHVPISPSSCCDDALVWNYQEILDVLWSGPARVCLSFISKFILSLYVISHYFAFYPSHLSIIFFKVRAVFAGHDHDGGYHYDKAHNIHHLTMPSPMTCRNYGVDLVDAILDVYDDRIEVNGRGNAPTLTFSFD
jgi:manganese-dependent ADP-ribose/CDP-alcohol diphosphatase